MRIRRPAVSDSKNPAPGHIPRRIEVTFAPAGLQRGLFGEAEFSRDLDGLLESRTGRRTDYFILIDSPPRNGNTEILRRMLALVGAGRIVDRVLIRHPHGEWDAGQYPCIVEALLPDFRTSRWARVRFQRSMDRTAKRVLRASALTLTATALGALTDIALGATLVAAEGNAYGSLQEGLRAAAQGVARLPMWAHLVSVVLGLMGYGVQTYWHMIQERVRSGEKPPPGPQLSDEERSFLGGRETKDFAPLRKAMSRSHPDLRVVLVEGADALDQFSHDFLTGPMFSRDPLEPGNRLFVLQFGSRESPLYRNLVAKMETYAAPSRPLVLARVPKMPVEDRIQFALAQGLTEEDARAAESIADLAEGGDPRQAGIQQRLETLARDYGPGASEPGLAWFLSLMASRGFPGPHSFTWKELSGIFAEENSTFARFVGMLGSKPPHLNILRDYLEALTTYRDFDVRMVDQGSRAGGLTTYAVKREYRAAMAGLPALRDPPPYAYSHGFWTAYLAQRLIGAQDEADSLVELCWHLRLLRFPEVPVEFSPALGQFAASIVRGAVLALDWLYSRAVFHPAREILSCLIREVLSRDTPWQERDFVAAVEDLAQVVWELGIVVGPWTDILDFHHLLQSRNARVGADGIDASVVVFGAYRDACGLRHVDRDRLRNARIVGGSTGTRLTLENLRSYALNLSLFRDRCVVQEMSELYAMEFKKVSDRLKDELASPKEEEGLSIFEHLVRGQRCRLALSLGRFDEAWDQLETSALRLAEQRGSLLPEHVLTRAFLYLFTAETIAGAIQGVVLNYAHPDALQRAAGLAEVLGRESRPLGGTVEDLLDDLTYQVYDLLEDGRVLHGICGIQWGAALLEGVGLRCGLMPTALRKAECESFLRNAWPRALESSRASGSEYLAVGAAATRMRHRDSLADSESAVKLLAETVMRVDNLSAGKAIARSLSHQTRLLNDREGIDLADRVFRWIIRGTHITPCDDDATVELAGWRLERAQTSRLLGGADARRGDARLEEASLLARQALQELEPLRGRSDRSDWKPLAWRACLEICWLSESTMSGEEVEQALIHALALEGVEDWDHFPQLEAFQLSRSLARGGCSNEELMASVHKITVPSFHRKYEWSSLVSYFNVAMGAARKVQCGSAELRELYHHGLEVERHVDEWVGLDRGIRFYEALRSLGSSEEDRLNDRHQTLLVLDLQLKERATRLSQQVAEASWDWLWGYLLDRFRNWIVYFEESGEEAESLAERIATGGLQGVGQAEIDSCLSRAGDVISHDHDPLVGPVFSRP